MSETVIKFMDKNKIKNSTVPGWFRLVKFNMEPAVGPLWVYVGPVYLKCVQVTKQNNIR